MLKNPGFDSDLANWGGAGAEWNSMDVDDCPYSGSVRVNTASGAPYQCVAVVAGTTYVYTAWYRNQPDKLTFCDFFAWSGPNCTGDVVGVESLIRGRETVWTYQSVTVLAPPGAVSARVQFDATGTYMDRISFGLSSAF